MTLSFLTPPRTVLSMTDDALYIYAVSPRAGVRLVESVPWDAEQFEENVATIIARDCESRPILVLNDMVEQHYRKEKVMRVGVGMMDRSSMLRRKLGAAFPNYPVKAAYALKEKLPKADKKISADIYIFAAIPQSRQFTHTLEAAQRSLATVFGFGLLPVEATDMIKVMSQKLSKKGAPSSKWVVFIGQHRNGGLRQVVIKGEDLALTRMTPMSDTALESDAWAAEAHQEFRATMSYLSRFGYQPEDGLDVILIGDKQAGSVFEGMLEHPCNLYSLSVGEASRLIGVNIGLNDQGQYADLLHVGWAGKKTKLILPLKAQIIDKVSRPRQVATAASFLLFVGASFLAYQTAITMTDIGTVNSNLDDSQERASQLQAQFEREVKRKEGLGFDVRLVQSSIAVVEGLEKENILALNVMNGIGKALGRDMRLDRVMLERPGGGVLGQAARALSGDGSQTEPPLFQGTMQMTYPSNADVEKGNQEVQDLKTRLEKFLPGHKVEVTKLLKDYEYVEEIVVETGDIGANAEQQDFIAEIKIEGPTSND